MPIDTDLPTDSPPADHGTPADSAVDDTGTDDREQVLVARVETYEGDADECTIYPVEAEAAALQTTWISAEEGSFVALDSMR
ncbi:DUF7511 domain-containing protein [Halobellus rufus]|uniref:DUF7511 domain-containing protein n=1 Tax=Halobellus rufus TaxID=1448860 RepID=UPI000678F44C|nr:hypothetical protein [Halobellus rufus]